MYVFIFLDKLTDWPPIGKIAAHSAYKMFSRYKYPIVSLVFFPTSGFWSGILVVIVPFPDLCLLVPFLKYCMCSVKNVMICNQIFRVQYHRHCWF